ncbi:MULTISPECIES: SusE domain-containing protein [Phocaeicola]|uniref:SusE domain-containing protein n=1 Tax=Phocaeicola faecium TaxID=2762213 RepID=A0ABR8VBF3_9BACT|nr:SusE domain-containing protein [Phocaeicola faecium]MBD8002110.1 SusE domain-containing protein [Phocaeicola faecium]
MKKLNIFAYCLAGMLAFSSCQDDRDDNPTILHPETFTLNASTETVYDLQNIETIDWTCDVPDYGYSAAVTYSVQINKDNNWVDAEGENAASYVTLEATYSTNQLKISAAEMDRSLIILNEWFDAETFPTTEQTVFVRIMSSISTVSGYEAYSEPVEIRYLPYYMEVSLEPKTMYVVGDHNGWAANDDAPRLIATDEAGMIFHGYAQLNTQFKFMTTDSWADPNYGGGSGTLALGGGNITATPGFYQIDANLNTMTYSLRTCTWGIVGSVFDSEWKTEVQLTYNSSTGALEADVEFSAGQFKFRQDGAWDYSLGGSLDELVYDGGNITASPGRYTVRLYLNGPTYRAELIPVE